jgi:hypothetical protein
MSKPTYPGIWPIPSKELQKAIFRRAHLLKLRRPENAERVHLVHLAALRFAEASA